jgi:hypothetical protein
MPFRAVDFDQYLPTTSALWNVEYPDMLRTEPETAASYAHMRTDAYQSFWLDGTDAAICLYDFSVGVVPIHLDVEVTVDPALDDRLFLPATEFATQTAQDLQAADLSIWIDDRRTNRANALATLGFAPTQTVPVSRLQITTFDPVPFKSRVDALQAKGIRISTVAELETNGIDWAPMLYEANSQMIEDMPNPHPPTIMPLEQFREVLKNPAVYRHELMFIALHGDELVGYSRVVPSGAMPDLVFTGLSGTVRAFRRQGVVTALKVAGIERLRQEGYRTLQTDNDETNPMYELNLQLGFKPAWRWVRMTKTLA